jgi:hypothetical protein
MSAPRADWLKILSTAVPLACVLCAAVAGYATLRADVEGNIGDIVEVKEEHDHLARDVKASNKELTESINGLNVTIAKLTAAVKHAHEEPD